MGKYDRKLMSLEICCPGQLPPLAFQNTSPLPPTPRNYYLTCYTIYKPADWPNFFNRQTKILHFFFFCGSKQDS